MLSVENPFADYGNIVHGPRLIGRHLQLKEIEHRIIHPPGGNLSIVGQRRVGKSSLAYQAIMARADELLAQRVLTFRTAVGTYDSSAHFFSDLAGACFRRLEDLGWANRIIRETYEDIRSHGLDRFDFGLVNEFFNATHEAKIRLIVLLDEFDMSSRFFDRDPAFFDRLRELSHRGQTTLLTISRSPIRVIEAKANITSKLAGICHDLYLSMYSAGEIDEHFGRLAAAGVTLSERERHRITERCGGHPFLHDKLAFELIELHRQRGAVHVEEAFQRSERVMLNEFKGIVDYLIQQELIGPLMRCLFASASEVRRSQISDLEAYGLIRPSKPGRYTAFATSFQEFLAREQPRPPEKLTETQLRVLHYLKAGLQNQEIASQLNISENTVKSHVKNLYDKLQVHNRTEAVNRGRDLGLID